MPVSGWKYFKWGTCRDCDHDDAALFLPVLQGEEVHDGVKNVIRGEHCQGFIPVCTKCREKYSLDVLCHIHKIPLRTDGDCQLCPRKPTPPKK